MIAGTCVIAVGMCVFHDSSHFGLFRKNIAGNDVFTRVFGALLMWRSEMWMMHHSFRHHTYTGDENLDPDVMNYHPIVRKTDRIDRKRVLNFPFNIIPYLITYFLWIFPGQCIG